MSSVTASLCCVICAEFYKSNDEILCTTCGHVFHKSCFENWQSRSITCPDCRFNQPQTQRIYLHFEEHTDLEHKFMQTKLELSNKISILEQKLQESEINLFDTLQVLGDKDDEVKKLLMDLEDCKAQNENYEHELRIFKEKQNIVIIEDKCTENLLNDSNIIKNKENFETEIEKPYTGAIKKEFFGNLNFDFSKLQVSEKQNAKTIKEECTENTLKDSNIVENKENIETKIEKPYTGAIKKAFFGNVKQIPSQESSKPTCDNKSLNVFPYNTDANPFSYAPQDPCRSNEMSSQDFCINSEISKFNFAIPKKSIFASRFAADTTKETIKFYIQEKIPKLDDIQVFKFNTPSYRRICSFRITVPESFYDRILNAEFWPSFVYVHEFIDRNPTTVATVAVLEPSDTAKIETETSCD